MIELLILIIVLGVIFYFVEMIPMSDPFKVLARVVIILIALLLLLRAVGLVNVPLRLG